MLALCLETSTHLGSVSISNETSILSDLNWSHEKSHSELVTSYIEEALDIAGITLDQIKILALDHGPGSFTGLRVGVNVIKTLSYVKNIPIYSFSSLKILTEACLQDDLPVLTVLNAQKNQYFFSGFRKVNQIWIEQFGPTFGTLDDIKNKWMGPCFIVGHLDFIDQLKDLKNEIKGSYSCSPSSQGLAKLIQKMNFTTHTPLSWYELKPLYLKSSMAEERVINTKKS